MTAQTFCYACRVMGLNDIGCVECPATQPETSIQVGDDIDDHDCIPSAGYTWCKAKSLCIRPWEYGIQTHIEFLAMCSVPTLAEALAGGDADSHGCRPSAGYKWCAAMSSCIRPWEHNITGSN